MPNPSRYSDPDPDLSLIPPHRALTILTSVFQSLAFCTGFVNLAEPDKDAMILGILLGKQSPIHQGPSNWHISKSAAFYNLATGLAGLGILLYLQFSYVATSSPAAATAVRKVIGITMLAGTIVRLGDSWVLSEFSHGPGLSRSAADFAGSKSTDHAIMAIPYAVLATAWLLS